jgi:hypothetical protein
MAGASERKKIGSIEHEKNEPKQSHFLTKLTGWSVQIHLALSLRQLGFI